MDRQRLLDLLSYWQEKGAEDGCDQEQKGDKAYEQKGSQVGLDGVNQRSLLVRKSPDDVKSPLGLNEKAACT